MKNLDDHLVGAASVGVMCVVVSLLMLSIVRSGVGGASDGRQTTTDREALSRVLYARER
jgi:hypothetical protein